MTIEIGVWEPVPESPGQSRQVRNRTATEVIDLLAEELRLDPPVGTAAEMASGETPAWIDEYLSAGFDGSGSPLPRYRWVAVYPVTGDSEGHYIHIDLVLSSQGLGPGPQTVKRIGIAKTFKGWEHACLLANRIARLLGA